jgi:hypothetical protein
MFVCGAIPAAAVNPYVWPVDGAPLCNGSGDQHAPFGLIAACQFVSFEWIGSTPGADTLASGGLSLFPPTGECSPFGPRTAVTGVTEVSTAPVFGFAVGGPLYPPSVIGGPFCTGPGRAETWLQGSGAGQQLIVHNPNWGFPVGADRQIVDDGDDVRHHPRMVASGIGAPDTAVVVVWSDERTGVPQIRAQRVTWTARRDWGPTGILLAATGAAQTEPEIALLADGTSLVVWLDARAGGSDVYALRVLSDGSPAPGWPATGLALESRPEIASTLRLAASRQFGGASFVAWEETGARFGGGRSIVARRLLADGTPDPAWDPQGAVLSSSATVERLQDVATAGAELVAVWTDTRAASGANPNDLYAQWVTNAGVPAGGWPASGLALSTAPGREDAARVSLDPGYAAFAWEDRRGSDTDIYAELRFKNGTLPLGNWVANGLPATSASGEQTAPVVGVGNGGGCFVAWQDARDFASTGLDIYAQAFTAEGEKLDVPPGTPGVALLGPPRPNPMRASSLFTLQLPREAPVNVEVLDVAGRRVRTLAAGTFPAGTRSVFFDGRDDAGRELPPGIYRVRGRIGDTETSRTVIRLR